MRRATVLINETRDGGSLLVKAAGRGMIPAALLILLSLPCSAQNIGAIPGAIHNNARDTEEFYRLQQQLNQAKPAQESADEELIVSPDTEPVMGSAESGQSIWVAKIVIDASEILSDEELSAVTTRYEERKLVMADLFAMLDEINQLYRDKNAVTSRAILPPQRVRDGVVQVQLIEARLDEVIFENNQSTNEGYLRRRIESESGELVDVQQLERDLVRFNAVNDVTLRAVLQPGSIPETTSYLINVQEPEHLATSMFVDNSGRETIGEERIGINFVNSSLTGRRDHLVLGGSVAEGTETAYARYNTPVNIHGTRVIASYDYSEIEVISGELESFNIRGKSTIASVKLSHPLHLGLRSKVFGLLGYNAKESETIFDRADRFESSIRSFSFTAEYRGLYDGYLLYANPRINAGVDNFGGDESFTTLDGELGGLVGLSPRQELLARLRGQWSDTDTLSSAEQFQLGGVSSVRGYPEGYLIGDEGYFMSLEYRYTLADLEQWLGAGNRLRALAFADHGGIYSSLPGDAPDQEDYLLSLGLGLHYQYVDRLQLSLQIGFPLDDKSSVDDDYAVHFLVTFSPF